MILRRILSSFIGVFLILLIFPLFSFARDEENNATSSVGVKVETSTSATSTKKVEYTLPYPGILPDHPLYFLKMFRDRVVGWFITDPLKKAEYNLLQADKRLGSGLSLIEKGKMDLAEQTISKGENYLEEALNEAEKAQKAGKDINALMSKLSLATLKHQEVLQEVLEKAPESAKKGLTNALEKSKRGAERVRSVQQKKLEKRLQERFLGRKLNPSSVEAKEKKVGK